MVTKPTGLENLDLHELHVFKSSKYVLKDFLENARGSWKHGKQGSVISSKLF